MTRRQRRKLEAEREDAEDADEGPDSEADEEVTILWRPHQSSAVVKLFVLSRLLP